MKLNLGCGTQTPAGWVNVDYALGARLARLPLFRQLNRKIGFFRLDWSESIYIHDLTRPLPWADSSVDAVYSSHTLEHLSREQGRAFLRECHRVLRPGGIVRIVVPDLQCVVQDYVDGRLAAVDFVDKLGVLYGDQRGGLRNRLAHFFQFPHQCMYDTPGLVALLKEEGFDARPRAPFDSGLEDIRAIELDERTQRAVIVEGIRQ